MRVATEDNATYPMLLTPVGKNYLWGGERLNREYKKNIRLFPLAETWECSTHPDGPSTVVNGPFAGLSLRYVLDQYPFLLGEKNIGIKELPILVKLIDAQKDLSVQVHPDDDYALMHENDRGKTELWHILDAQPGAHLVYGFEHQVSKKILIDALREGTLDKHLHKVEVKRGDSFFIPAGTVHALGAGILVAEIQESSNVTYRVYDYDRVGLDGKRRELHFDKAIEVMKMEPELEDIKKGRLFRFQPGQVRELLCQCRYFEVERLQCVDKLELEITEDSYQVILILEGTARINGPKEPLDVGKGQCVFLPAKLGKVSFSGNIELLHIC